MTKEEAIERFENVKTNALVQKAIGVSEYWQNEIDGTIEAIDMAIEALANPKQEFESADPVHTCNTCADKALCIMSAPDGNWRACKDYKRADFVAVVRCKDCRWQKFIDWGMGDCLHPKGSKHIAYDNHYCSYGERK